MAVDVGMAAAERPFADGLSGVKGQPVRGLGFGRGQEGMRRVKGHSHFSHRSSMRLSPPITTIPSRKSEYAMGQFSAPVIIVHSDIPPMPASRVRGMKTVMLTLRRDMMVEEQEAVVREDVELGDLVLVQAVFEAQRVQVQGRAERRQLLGAGAAHVEPHEPGLGEALHRLRHVRQNAHGALPVETHTSNCHGHLPHPGLLAAEASSPW